MDGSNAAFLFEEPAQSHRASHLRNGILYIEDFDDVPSADVVEAPEAVVPIVTAADVKAAYEAGHEAGLQAALADEHLLREQLRLAALQSLAEALLKAEAGLAAVARTRAEETARVLIGILRAAIPATMRVYGKAEIDDVIRVLLPGLRCEPELRVRVHQDLADTIRESLVAQLPDEGCVLSVCADEALEAGDVRIAWKDGHANRDCGAIWADISAVLAPLNLSHSKDLQIGQ